MLHVVLKMLSVAQIRMETIKFSYKQAIAILELIFILQVFGCKDTEIFFQLNVAQYVDLWNIIGTIDDNHMDHHVTFLL